MLPVIIPNLRNFDHKESCFNYFKGFTRLLPDSSYVNKLIANSLS